MENSKIRKKLSHCRAVLSLIITRASSVACNKGLELERLVEAGNVVAIKTQSEGCDRRHEGQKNAEAQVEDPLQLGPGSIDDEGETRRSHNVHVLVVKIAERTERDLAAYFDISFNRPLRPRGTPPPPTRPQN